MVLDWSRQHLPDTTVGRGVRKSGLFIHPTFLIHWVAASRPFLRVRLAPSLHAADGHHISIKESIILVSIGEPADASVSKYKAN